MTQVIACVTQDYALLVADRRLTFVDGPRKGEIADDDSCKLVSLCNLSGIGYTGLAQIEECPTHEWIAKKLAAEECSDPGVASLILAERTREALLNLAPAVRRQEFVLTGWSRFADLEGLRPYIGIVSNMADASGRILIQPGDSFARFVRALRDQDDPMICIVGHSLMRDRVHLLKRNLRRLIVHEISPKETLRLLVDEVIHTAGFADTVGKKVLALCIPRKAAQAVSESGTSTLRAGQPTDEDKGATFCYFDPSFNELQQYGPTVTCGGFAATDFITQNDDANNRQSSQMRILAKPKPKGPDVSSQEPFFKRALPTRPIIAFEFGISLENAVKPGARYRIPAAIRNTGQVPIEFAKNLTDDVGQETLPSVQGGAVPAITFCWPTGGWSIGNFEPVSRTKFAGVVIQPGEVFEFDFGALAVPHRPVGRVARSDVVDFSIQFTDTIRGCLLNITGKGFRFPTNLNKPLLFRMSRESASSRLTFCPARVIDTETGELISGPVEGTLPVLGKQLGPITDTSICGGKPGIMSGPK
jgi:hypothetical protein